MVLVFRFSIKIGFPRLWRMTKHNADEKQKSEIQNPLTAKDAKTTFAKASVVEKDAKDAKVKEELTQTLSAVALAKAEDQEKPSDAVGLPKASQRATEKKLLGVSKSKQ